MKIVTFAIVGSLLFFSGCSASRGYQKIIYDGKLYRSSGSPNCDNENVVAMAAYPKGKTIETSLYVYPTQANPIKAQKLLALCSEDVYNFAFNLVVECATTYQVPPLKSTYSDNVVNWNNPLACSDFGFNNKSQAAKFFESYYFHKIIEGKSCCVHDPDRNAFLGLAKINAANNPKSTNYFKIIMETIEKYPHYINDYFINYEKILNDYNVPHADIIVTEHKKEFIQLFKTTADITEYAKRKSLRDSQFSQFAINNLPLGDPYVETVYNIEPFNLHWIHFRKKDEHEPTNLRLIKSLGKYYTLENKKRLPKMRKDYAAKQFAKLYKISFTRYYVGQDADVTKALAWAYVLKEYGTFNKPSLEFFEIQLLHRLKLNNAKQKKINAWVVKHGKKNKWYRKIVELSN